MKAFPTPKYLTKCAGQLSNGYLSPVFLVGETALVSPTFGETTLVSQKASEKLALVFPKLEKLR
jgi:hypothetical protein